MTTAWDSIDDAIRRIRVRELSNLSTVTYSEIMTDAVMEAIRGMSHDELRELRPDIAILFDATQDTANTRGDYIINLIVGRLRAAERLHTTADDYETCAHDGRDWPCPTTRAIRGQA